MAEFEWDPEKEQRNIREPRIDFSTASQIWAGLVIERVDDRRDYGEVRIIATGEVGGHLMVVVYTWRQRVRRIISARKANHCEKRRFDARVRHRQETPN